MVSAEYTIFQNPPGYDIDFDLLQKFERGLDTMKPERSQVPCRVLGYGEISTVFEILVNELEGLAFKRLSIFETGEEIDKYLQTYLEYNRLLDEQVRINLPLQGYAVLPDNYGYPIFYIIQSKLSAPAICNKALHLLPEAQVLTMFECILRDLLKLWQFNQSDDGIELGIDGQSSNWVIQDFDPNQAAMAQDTSLVFIDNSTPMVRLNGEEQLDTELFLRSAPSFLVWILRILFLEDVINRYYDLRLVIIDLLANCYKEQKAEMIPDLIGVSNEFIAGPAAELGLPPITEKEVKSYYREDAMIWRLYLSMRRFDRYLHRYILRRPYRYILPGKTKR